MSEVNFKNFKEAYIVTHDPAYRDNDVKLVLNQIYPYVMSMTKQLGNDHFVYMGTRTSKSRPVH